VRDEARFRHGPAIVPSAIQAPQIVDVDQIGWIAGAPQLGLDEDPHAVRSVQNLAGVGSVHDQNSNIGLAALSANARLTLSSKFVVSVTRSGRCADRLSDAMSSFVYFLAMTCLHQLKIEPRVQLRRSE
jgi:hypothetical protein